MNRRVLAVFIATVLAIGGGVLVLLYAKKADERAAADLQPTKVYVAAKVIPSGTTLKDAQRTELITETNVPAKAVPLGYLSDIDADNNSLLALSEVQAGEVLMTARFGTTPVGAKAIEVPAGKVAVSVELKDPARVGKFVTPGSHLAIYQTYKKVRLGTDELSKIYNSLNFKGTNVLLEDVLVIGMGETPLNAPPASSSDEEEDGNGLSRDRAAPSFLVTVAVTPEQSVKLVHSINGYTLYASLRGSDVKFPPGFESNAETEMLEVPPKPSQP